jgi:broad specificity phosphatase PhoE
VRAACADVAADAVRRDVVVVTHVSPIKAAVAWALGVGDDVAWRMWVATASVTRIGVADDGTPSLRGFNDLSHLG